MDHQVQVHGDIRPQKSMQKGKLKHYYLNDFFFNANSQNPSAVKIYYFNLQYLLFLWSQDANPASLLQVMLTSFPLRWQDKSMVPARMGHFYGELENGELYQKRVRKLS